MSLSDVIGDKVNVDGVPVNIEKASNNKDFKKYVSLMGYLNYFLDENGSIKSEFSTNGYFDGTKFKRYVDQHESESSELVNAYNMLNYFVKSYLYFEGVGLNRCISGVPSVDDANATTFNSVGERMNKEPVSYIFNELRSYLKKDGRVIFINKGIFGTLGKMIRESKESNAIDNMYKLTLFLKSYYDNNSGDYMNFLEETKKDVVEKAVESLKNDVENDQAFKPYETKYSNGGNDVDVDNIASMIANMAIFPLDELLGHWNGYLKATTSS